jgi:predicted metal-dependent hydrolase
MRSLLQFTLDLFDPTPAPAPVPPAPEVPRGPYVRGEAFDDVLARAAFRHPQANREVLLGHCVVAYHFKRARRRTIGFLVGTEGLTVSAPRWVPLHEVDAAVREKQVWIVRKLDEARERQQRLESARVEWRDGAQLPFLGEQVIVVLDPRQADGGAGAVLHTAFDTLPGVPRLTLHVGLPQHATAEQIRDMVQAWLMRQAKRLFTERMDHFAPRLGVRWRRLSLSSAGTRWGSASADGSIRLNWRLVHFRPSVIDYVVVHELSHLRVMDHSPRFWDTVASVMPDYAALRGQLKDEAIPRW